MLHHLTRRQWLGGAVAAGIAIVPRHVLGGAGYRPPSSRLALAGVGVGGVGLPLLEGCEHAGFDSIARALASTAP